MTVIIGYAMAPWWLVGLSMYLLFAVPVVAVYGFLSAGGLAFFPKDAARWRMAVKISVVLGLVNLNLTLGVFGWRAISSSLTDTAIFIGLIVSPLLFSILALLLRRNPGVES